MKKKRISSAGWAPLMLFAVLLLALLLLVVFATGIYAQLIRVRSADEAGRAQLTYLSAQVHAADAKGGVTVVDGPQGSALALGETDADGQRRYETRIYLFNGELMEEYARVGDAFAPEKAQLIAATAQFTVTVSGGVVNLWTDAGEIRVALRSASGVNGDA